MSEMEKGFWKYQNGQVSRPGIFKEWDVNFSKIQTVI